MGRKQKRAGLELKKNWPGYLLLAPAVTAVLALSIYPLFRGIYLSFVNYNLVRPKDSIFNTFAGLEIIRIYLPTRFSAVYRKYSKMDTGESCYTACGSHAVGAGTEYETERKVCIPHFDSGAWAVPHAIAAMTFYLFI